MSFTVPDYGAVRADVERLARSAASRARAGERIGNPLLDLWRATPGQQTDRYGLTDPGGIVTAGAVRDPGHDWFAWAIPDDTALDAITRHSARAGIVEVGAGTGYWARQVEDRGLPVVAYDLHPFGCRCDSDHWCRNGKRAQWARVHRGGPEAAAKHPDRTLLLVWPPYYAPMGAVAVAAYHAAGGHTVAYVGEGAGGCTGDDAMHRLLGDEPWCWSCDHIADCDGCDDDADHHEHDPSTHPVPLFEHIESVAIPQWAGLHDVLRIYRRATP